jgi:hypothetical protein
MRIAALWRARRLPVFVLNAWQRQDDTPLAAKHASRSDPLPVDGAAFFVAYVRTQKERPGQGGKPDRAEGTSPRKPTNPEEREKHGVDQTPPIRRTDR